MLRDRSRTSHSQLRNIRKRSGKPGGAGLGRTLRCCLCRQATVVRVFCRSSGLPLIISQRAHGSRGDAAFTMLSPSPPACRREAERGKPLHPRTEQVRTFQREQSRGVPPTHSCRYTKQIQAGETPAGPHQCKGPGYSAASIGFIRFTSRGFSAHPLGWLVFSRSRYFVISLCWVVRGFSEWPSVWQEEMRSQVRREEFPRQEGIFHFGIQQPPQTEQTARPTSSSRQSKPFPPKPRNHSLVSRCSQIHSVRNPGPHFKYCVLKYAAPATRH